jgi:hypothetical protein
MTPQCIVTAGIYPVDIPVHESMVGGLSRRILEDFPTASLPKFLLSPGDCREITLRTYRAADFMGL